MRYAVTFEVSSGEVRGRVSYMDGDEVSVPGGFNWVITDDDAPLETLWFDGSTLVRRPAPPSAPYTWAAESFSWVISLAKAREQKLLEIKAQRNATETGPFSWGPHTFDGDVDSQRRLGYAAQMASQYAALGEPFSIDWTLYDNTTVTLTGEDVIAAFTALGFHINAAHQTARARKAAVLAANSVEEVDSA